MRIDLHTHSSRSDGTDTPADLVAAAAAAGLDVLALTDHDSALGWDEAARAAERHGVRLLRGMEVSCTHAGDSVHLLAYLADPTHPGLVAELDAVLAGRTSRVPAMVRRLVELGFAITEDDVAAVSGDATALGRPHVADALVARGHVRDRDQAFAELLGAGGPAYVDRYAADLVTMIGLVADAGGVSVVAHPWGRYPHGALDADGLAALRDSGLDGVEVEHQDHDAATRRELGALVAELGLVATGGSDHHGTGKVDHDLGCCTTTPEALQALVGRATSRVPRA